MTDLGEHWQRAHDAKKPEEQSWFQSRPEVSLALIERAGVDRSARIIDVGGGASRLVDALIALGYRDLSVLDIAPAALAQAKQRLGDDAHRVQWIEADVTSVLLGPTFDLWHDRAVFHFLTEAEQRVAYVRTMKQCLKVGGHAIIATFAQDGPSECSGLPVVRYGTSSLLEELGEGFSLVETRGERHRTPAGREQSFVYGFFGRVAATSP